jgi:hypothetical protein
LTDEEKALIDKLSPKIQKRFDAETQEKLALRKRIEELEANAGAGKKDRTLAEYSEDELYELKKQNPAYEKYVDKELIKREAKKIVEESQSKTSAVTQAQKYDEIALKTFPELSDPDSELFKLANIIYDERGYGKIVDGTLVAAQRAQEILSKGKKKKGKVVNAKEKERSTAIKKYGVSGSTTAGSGAVTSARLDKLEEKAVGTRRDSPEWAAVFREQARMKALREKSRK